MENKNILIIVGAIVLIYFLFLQPAVPREGVVIEAYDINGRLLDTIEMSRGDLQAVVAEGSEIVQLLPIGSATVKFFITVENTGNMPITATYISGLLESV